MNPSFPGGSGERHGATPPPPPGSMGGTSGANPMNKGFHPQPPPLSQRPHSNLHHALHPPGSSHHSHGTTGPPHGSHTSQHPSMHAHNQLHGHSGPMLHAPTLPPPPTSLSATTTARSPHHALPGGLLHPPRSTPPPSVLSKPGSMAVSASGGPTNVSGTSAVLMSHPVRMQTQPITTGPPAGANVPTSVVSGASASMTSSATGNVVTGGPGNAMKTAQGFSLRPSSPRRNEPTPSNVNASSGSKPYPMDRNGGSNEGDGEGSGGNYYGSNMNKMSIAPPPRQRELRVEDALLYLDQVKQQFGDQPDIYNQFLDVMKAFKAQDIDTPGVILRVSQLFRGYPNLILGFNTFLPPGYRIRPDTSIEVIPPHTLAARSGPQQSMYSAPMQPAPVAQPGPMHVGNKQSPAPRQNMNAAPPAASTAPPPKVSPPSAASKGAGNKKPSVEFDHAIHYVTTIKQRFANEPEIYKEFLAILHTYQKEQRSIRQVLDQVSYLFRDHPDLLREFTFFLPDAVQEQAKERLNRAAEKAQQRKDQMAKPRGGQTRDGGQSGFPQASGTGTHGRREDHRVGGMHAMESPTHGTSDDHPMLPDDRGRGHKIGMDRTKADPPFKQAGIYDDEGRRLGKGGDRREKETERERNKALFAQKRSKRRNYDSKERRDFMALSDVVLDKDEWGLFERIKKILPSRDSWREFLKCLELYSQEVLERKEMMSLIRNLFGRHSDLVEEFDQLLCSHGEQKNPHEVWPFIPLAETDLSQCRRATPSYRALPASYPIPPCSHRSELEKSVCNDSWVSVPTGSEDFSFKNMRKNQYEEALFKCEDERFEIDMVIDANASTISVLEPLAREIEVLKEKDGGEEKLWNYVVDKGTFRVTHLNAITRIYGEAGPQILDLLRKYPAGAIPVILRRLKQKDEEWRRARQDLNKQWKEVNEKNYHKSLDHSSFYFKQKDKKQTSMKILVQEAKKKLEVEGKQPTADSENEKLKTEPPNAKEITDALNKDQSIPTNGEAAMASSGQWKPHFSYKFASAQIHKDAFGLLSYAAEKNLGSADKEKVSKVWQSMFFPFFHLEEEWLLRKPKRTTVTVEKAKRLRMGTEVSTDFGDGTIQYFNEEEGHYVVNLPMGLGYLQPESITIEESSDLPPNLLELDDESKAIKDQDQITSVLLGSQHAYVFLRLYQMLHSRLERAHELCEKAKRNRFRRTVNPAARALAHARHSSNDVTTKEKTGDYQAFLSKLYALIDGSVDNTKYEDCCRSLMGSTSYFLFTMDKLVSLILKQMQHLAADETCQELLKLFAEQRDQQKAGALDRATYLSKSKAVFDGEGAYRLEFAPGVLRRTPLEPRASTPAASDGANFKIWAPSPRVRHHEPSRWLIEPKLSMEYLGAVDEDEDDEDENENENENEDSPSPTPPETPSETPVYGSPYREANETNEASEENTENGEMKEEAAHDAPLEGENSGEESGEASSEDEEAPRRDLTSVLKKRPRSHSEDGNGTDGVSSTASKKSKTEESVDGEDEEGGETENTGEEDNTADSHEAQEEEMKGEDKPKAEGDSEMQEAFPAAKATPSPEQPSIETDPTDNAVSTHPSDEVAKGSDAAEPETEENGETAEPMEVDEGNAERSQRNETTSSPERAESTAESS